MRRILTVLCIMALAVALAIPAYAAVQNVKVSGDITVRGIGRWDNDLNSSDDSVAVRTMGATPLAINDLFVLNTMTNSPARGIAAGAFTMGTIANNATSHSNIEQFIMSTTRLRVDADLTDNVSATVGLLNQRDWMDPQVGAAGYRVNINLAYVTLKEMLYAPLTVTVGRQDLWFGKGFIVGQNNLLIGDSEGSISADEYNAQTAFDAARATLNYDPLTIDLVYSRITEGPHFNPASSEYEDLFGINAGYAFDQYNAEVEAYYWFLYDQRYKYADPADIGRNNTALIQTNSITGLPYNAAGLQMAISVPADSVHTVGARGSVDPITNLTIAGEVAGQFGTSWYVNATNGSYASRGRLAMAGDISGEYRFADMTWTPKIGAEYIYYSGEEAPRGNNNPTLSESDGTDNAWHVMFRGKYDTALREFQGGHLHGKAIMAGNYLLDDFRTTPGFTNQHQVGINGAVTPLKDITLDGRFTFFWTAEDVEFNRFDNNNIDTRDSHLGNELDVQLTYNYTEDVTFGILGAWFFPGDFFGAGHGGTTVDDFTGANNLPTRARRQGDIGDVAGGDPFNQRGDDVAAEVVGSMTVVF